MLGGSGRLNVLLAFVSLDFFGWNGEAALSSHLMISSVFTRLLSFSDKLILRRKSDERFVFDLILPLIIVLNDVGKSVFSSSDSMSSRSMHSSSIDSIESDDKLLNERKQLVDNCFDADDGVFGGDCFGALSIGSTNVNNLRLLLLNPESTELIVSDSRSGDNIPNSRHGLTHGRGLPCGLWPE